MPIAVSRSLRVPCMKRSQFSPFSNNIRGKMDPRPIYRVLRFGPYEVDTSLGELRKEGSRVHIQEKPLRVLVALAENQGELVTRVELQKSLWQDETFVDFDNGLNTAIRKLRIALGEESGGP